MDLFIFRHKTGDCIPGHNFANGYRHCFLELHFQRISTNKRIKTIYKDTELVLPTYNAHLCFSLKNLGKRVVHSIHGKI